MADTTQSSQGQSTTQSSGQSGQYFNDPQVIQQIVQMLTGVAGGASSQYLNFLQNPTASPLYQNQLSGVMSALAPGEAKQRQQLGDVFRGAGNMSSGQYGTSAAQLIGQQGLNRGTIASQLLGQMFPQMAQALMQPMTLAEQLINALKMSQSSQQSQGQSSQSSQGQSSTPQTSTQQGGTTLRDLIAMLTGQGQGGQGQPPSLNQSGYTDPFTGAQAQAEGQPYVDPYSSQQPDYNEYQTLLSDQPETFGTSSGE